MNAHGTGRVIGAGFGLVYVLVNAWAVGAPADLVLRVLAVVAVAALGVVLGRGRRGVGRGERPPSFGRGYLLVVAAEVAAIVGGSALLGVLGQPGARFPWLTIVVGVHFVLLARVWREPSIGWLGWSLTGCGAAGFVAALAVGSPALVAGLAGLLPGVLLLAGSFWGLGARLRQPA